jgi:predicted dehydrogenase
MTTMHGVPFAKHDEVRIGLIGCGNRGGFLLGELLAVPGVRLVALTDQRAAAAEKAAARVVAAGQPAPLVFSGDDGWRRVIDAPIDLAYIATPWDTHTPYAVAAMEAGRHAAVEVPAAVTLEECWQLVETSERTRRHCVMLENCCYDEIEMSVKRMVRAGLLGTLTHAECAYIHDLRSLLLSDESEGLWRRQPHIDRVGNLYPTHGLGPVAQCLDVGGVDAFDYMVSMSSREAALREYRDAVVPADSPKRAEVYRHGDMNTSIVRTKLGRTILLQHDVVTPRPYDRNFLIAGTRGTFRNYPPRLYIDGVSKHEEWFAHEQFRSEWEDPLWKTLGAYARERGGHGGMDYIMNYRLIQTLRDGLPPDSDVYDAADWSAPGPLSEMSVARKSAAVEFPAFRRGK